MAIKSAGTLDLGGAIDAAGGKALLTAAQANVSATYIKVPPGTYNWSVYPTGQRQSVIKTFNVMVPDKGYFTILMTQDMNGKMIGELIDETPDPKVLPVNRAIIRQLSLGSKVMAMAGAQKTGLLDYGDTQALEQLANGNVSVAIHGITPKGPRNWAVQVDYLRTHKATVYIFTDAYGRMRARVTEDGPHLEEEATAQPPGA